MTPERRFFKRPEENETLAARQEEKLRRLNHFREKFPAFTRQWWVGAGEWLGIVGLLLVNFFLLRPFFNQADEVNVFSAPVIPVLASILENFVPHAYAVRIWLLIFLIFFPLSFYFFVREISGRKLIGFLSAYIASLPVGIFLPVRVNLGLLAEDGAHIASLTLIPLVCLGLLRFLRQGRFWMGILTALGTSVVALTTPIGSLVLLVFMVAVTFSEMLLGQGRLKAMRFLVIFLLATGFSAFWYNPKFIFLTLYSPQGQLIQKTFFNLLPISFFLFPILGVFGFLLFENRAHLQAMFMAFFLTGVFGLFSLGAGVAHPSPSRFLPALGISLAFLLAIVIGELFDFLRFPPFLEKRFKFWKRFQRAFSLVLMSLVITLILGLIFVFRDSLVLAQTQTLGVMMSDKTTGIWEIKEQTTRVESLVGYGISAATALSVLILKLRLR